MSADAPAATPDPLDQPEQPLLTITFYDGGGEPCAAEQAAAAEGHPEKRCLACRKDQVSFDVPPGITLSKRDVAMTLGSVAYRLLLNPNSMASITPEVKP
ncbi:hypothetical protein [Angustibacter luteus]|uniref:Uncharacterized protein n=1 Tax=Angustibacter luteus TaxID=658456 RepID=A0ABW1JJL5_9ACTN